MKNVTKSSAKNCRQHKNSRHQVVLKQLIQSYIEKGEPVASRYLVVHYGINFSSATIRNDFQELTSEGYLEKFHVSSGRVPTNKAWRFFINTLLQDKEIEEWQEKWRFLLQDRILMYSWEEILNLIASQLNIFSFCYLREADEVKKCGFGYLLSDLLEELLFNREKDSFKKNLIENIVNSLEEFDKNMKSLNIVNEGLFVGKKNPFLKIDCLSAIIVRTKKTETLIGILGNKRMAYAKNLGLLRLVADVK